MIGRHRPSRSALTRKPPPNEFNQRNLETLGDTLSRPTFRNLTDSFESWAYRNGFVRQIQRLEKQELLECRTTSAGDRLHRLSQTGRLLALGGRDPVERWNRGWDGRWRLVLFDVPENRSTIRNNLRRCLQNQGFGYLQNSVWITPDPVSEESELLVGSRVDVESLVLFEGRPCAGESDSEIVAGAWNFAAINQGYARNQQVLERRPHGALDTKPSIAAFHRWVREERESWQKVMKLDPLLPKALLPSDYAGRTAWDKRRKVLAEAANQMRIFNNR